MAATFFVHGWAKIPADGFAQGSGLPLPIAWLVALGELSIPVLLILGAFTKPILTRLGGLVAVVIMIGAILMVHISHGWNIQAGGMEFAAILLAVGAYFAVKGNDV
jgi:putative oxidoreductase